MTITVNGQEHTIEAPTTVAQVVRLLLDEAGPSTKGAAVALNEHVVPRGRWESVTIADGDRLEVLAAVAGG